MTRSRTTARVRGSVQGVGLRAWVVERAQVLALDGWARNDPDGSVEVVAQGEADDVEALVEALRSADDRPGRVTGVETAEGQPDPGLSGFTTR